MMNIYATVDVAAVTEEVVEGVYAGQVYQDISSTEATGELSFPTHNPFLFTSYFGGQRPFSPLKTSLLTPFTSYSGAETFVASWVISSNPRTNLKDKY